MSTKTKAELEREIRDSRCQIESLKCELEQANRVENNDKSATQLYEIYESHIKAGFTNEQAWELTKIMVNYATMNRGLL